jgi:hypothetical protein
MCQVLYPRGRDSCTHWTEGYVEKQIYIHNVQITWILASYSEPSNKYYARKSVWKLSSSWIHITLTAIVEKVFHVFQNLMGWMHVVTDITGMEGALFKLTTWDYTALKSKCKTNLCLYMPWRHVGGVKVYLHSFLTMALDGSDQPHSPTALSPGKEPPPPTEQAAGWLLELVCTYWRRDRAPAADRIWTLDSLALA